MLAINFRNPLCMVPEFFSNKKVPIESHVWYSSLHLGLVIFMVNVGKYTIVPWYGPWYVAPLRSRTLSSFASPSGTKQAAESPWTWTDLLLFLIMAD